LGSGWVGSQLPWLSQDGNTLVAIAGANQYYFFDPTGNGDYRVRYFFKDMLQQQGNTLVMTDTMGDEITFHDFSSSTPASQRGQFMSLTDPAGNTTTVTSTNPDGTIAEIQRTDSSTGLTESYLYDYVSSGP